LLAATLLGGILATALVRRDAVRDRRARENAAAEVAARALTQVAAQVVAQLRGANALVDANGVVARSSFRSFAEDVVGGAVFDSVAREVVVTANERSAFEAQNQGPIVERDTSGAFVRAPAKERYLPVIDVWPVNELTRTLPGFDVSSDPVRAATITSANTTASPAISAPLRLAPSNAPGYFVVHPLFRRADRRAPGDDIVGYVSAAFPASTLIERTLDVLPEGTRLALIDGDSTTASDPAPRPRAASADGEFGGRLVQLVVQIPGGASWTPAVLTALASLAGLAGLVATLALIGRIEADGDRAARLADLAQRLAACRSTDDTRSVLQATCSALLGATKVDIREVDDSDAVVDDTGVGTGAEEPIRRVLLRSVEGEPLAVMEIRWSNRASAERVTPSLVNTVADMTAQSLDRIHHAEDDATRAAAMAALARELAAGSTTEDLTMTLLQRAPAVVGCAIVQFGLTEDDWLTIRAVGRDDPAVVMRRVSLSHRTPMTVAIHTDAPVLLPDTEAFEAQFPEIVPIATEPWLSARAALPLRRSDGAVFGAIGFGWGRPVSYPAPLRATITTVVDLAAQALERSEFTGRQTRAALSLADFAQHLAAANDHRDVEIVVEQRLRGILQARAVSLRYLSLAVGSAASERDTYHSIVQQGRTAIVTDDATMSKLSPIHEHAGAIGIIPIRDADGTVIAAISIAWRRAVSASDALMAMLDTVGTMVSQTISRTRLFEIEHGLFRDLQAELLRPLPDAPGIEAAAVYEPASRTVDVGGDWYSAVRLSEHRVAFVIGDVLGHGVEAVAAMGRLQSMVLGLLTSLPTLDDVFTRASQLVHDDGATLASALLVVVDSGARTIEYVSAGHPPALLRRDGGDVLVLEGARQSLLGLPLDSQRMRREAFPVSSVLVMYTDGLVERRSEELDAGIARLERALLAVDDRASAGAIAARLLDDCREFADVRADDTAVIVVKSV
jgi:serine phosphatase RsbU (regulator of sigma subunit)/CHASE1-domain containing sensor protein